MSKCNCREEIDAKLAPHNTRVEMIFTLGEGGLGMPWPISTAQVEKGRGKARAMKLFASHCPFCGVALREET